MKKRPAKRTHKKKVDKSKPKAGRSKYVPSPEHKETAYIGAKKGLSEKQIAEAIGISYKTFYKYKSQFKEHIKRGRAESDNPNCDKVESAQLKRALGYEYTETHESQKQIVDAKTGKATGYVEITKKTVTKHVVADVTAQIFYLCNRRKLRWQSINRAQYGEGSDIPIPVISYANGKLPKEKKK